MAVQYTGRQAARHFARMGTRLYNGTRASPSLFRGLGDNQTWLATQDTPATNFYTNAGFNANRTSQKIQVSVDLPPFVRWVEFYFWCVWNMDETITQPPYIRVACTETGTVRKAFAGSGGSDTPAGKGTSGNTIAQQARWVSFVGTDVGVLPNPEDYPLAVDGISTPTNTWVTATFEVSAVAANDTQAPIILTGYYRVLPAQGALLSQDP